MSQPAAPTSPGWTPLAGYPRTFASRYAPTESVVRVVAGAPERGPTGKPVMLRGAKAFAQGLEQAIVAEHRAGLDDAAVEALVAAALEARAATLDGVDWAIRRGDDLDLGLRVYATRGVTRLVMSLRGPVGAWADREPPPLPKPARPAKAAAATARATKARAPDASAAASAAAATLARAVTPTAPSGPGWLGPLVAPGLAMDGAPGVTAAGATAVYGDALGFEPDGTLVVAARLRRSDASQSYAWVAVEPSGAVRVAELPTRDALRADDPQVMTAAILPGLYPTPDALVRVEHFERSTGLRERVHLGAARSVDRALNGLLGCLGRMGPWLVRVVSAPRLQLVLVHAETGKRSRLDLVGASGALDGDPGVLGTYLDAALDGDVLRVLSYAGGARCIARYHIVSSPALGRAALGSEPAPEVGDRAAIALVPAGDALVAFDARGLRLVAGGVERTVVAFPPAFAEAGLEPWGVPRAQAAAGGRFIVTPHLGPSRASSDDGPGARLVIAFDGDGRALHALRLDASGALRALSSDDAADAPLTPPGHLLIGAALGPSGELAVLLAADEGRALAVYRTAALGGADLAT